MAGNYPDYIMAVFLFVPIVLHAVLISKNRKNSMLARVRCTLAYAGVVFVLCFMQFWGKSHSPGWGEWYGNTSLVAFLICSGFFVMAFFVCALRPPRSVDWRIPIFTSMFIGLWMLVIVGIVSYLYAFRQISKVAINAGVYTTDSRSSFVVFHERNFSPRWRRKFYGDGFRGNKMISEIHASLRGRIIFARGGNFECAK